MESFLERLVTMPSKEDELRDQPGDHSDTTECNKNNCRHIVGEWVCQFQFKIINVFISIPATPSRIERILLIQVILHRPVLSSSHLKGLLAATTVLDCDLADATVSCMCITLDTSTSTSICIINTDYIEQLVFDHRAVGLDGIIVPVEIPLIADKVAEEEWPQRNEDEEDNSSSGSALESHGIATEALSEFSLDQFSNWLRREVYHDRRISYSIL